jgi:DNA-nicking Smr family endonuclease
MRRKKKHADINHGKRRPAAEPKDAFPSPFKELKKMLAGRAGLDLPESKTETAAKPPAHQDRPAATLAQAPPDDEAALLEAYRGVRPLEGGGRVPVKPEVGRAVVSEDSEVLAALYDLVSGQGGFDLTETDEYVEGARVGIDPRLVTRLRRGEFPMQAHLDLHGMTQAAAREALSSFIVESVRRGLRSVLVVHGRGLRSAGGHPVLKHATAHWLSHGTIGGHVLAFATACPSDGGAGATYVLLRRDRKRGPFDVLKGTKRYE